MKTVAVIDDSRSMLKAMQGMIEACGHRAELFKNPIEAVDSIPLLHIDLVIVDYLMFDMDGLEVIRTLKKSGFDKPIVLYTSLCDSDTPFICEEMNVGFCKKPLQIIELKQLFDDYFK